MPQALPKQVIIEYQDPGIAQLTKSGLFELSQAARRELLKGKTHNIDVDKPLPDLIRYGRVVSSGEPRVKVGMWVAFPKHDADLFEYDGKTYYRAALPLAHFPEKFSPPSNG